MDFVRAKSIYQDSLEHFKETIRCGDSLNLQAIGMGPDRVIWVPSFSDNKTDFYNLCKLVFARFKVKYYATFSEGWMAEFSAGEKLTHKVSQHPNRIECLLTTLVSRNETLAESYKIIRQKDDIKLELVYSEDNNGNTFSGDLLNLLPNTDLVLSRQQKEKIDEYLSTLGFDIEEVKEATPNHYYH